MKHLLSTLVISLIAINAWGYSVLFRKDATVPHEIIEEIALKYKDVPDSIFEFEHSNKGEKYYMFITPTEEEIVTYTYYARNCRKKTFYSQMGIIHHVLQVSRPKNANKVIPLIESFLKSNQDYIWQSATIDKADFRASFSRHSLAQIVRGKMSRTVLKSIPQKVESYWLEIVDMDLSAAVDRWQSFSFGNVVPFTMKVLSVNHSIMPVILVKMNENDSDSYAIIIRGKSPHFFLLADIYSTEGYSSSYLKLLDVLDSVLPSEDDNMKLKCFSLINQLVEELSGR